MGWKQNLNRMETVWKCNRDGMETGEKLDRKGKEPCITLQETENRNRRETGWKRNGNRGEMEWKWVGRVHSNKHYKCLL